MPAHIDPEDPSLSAAELDRVEDDLDQILEESPWPSGEKYLAPSLVCASLHQRGHSPESIKAALNRLRAAKVFDVRHYPPGVMVDPEPNKYYTTRQRWSAYLAARRAAPAVRPAAALAYDPTRDQPGTLAEWNRHALVTETCWRGGMYSRIPVQLQPAPGSGLARLLAYCEARWGTPSPVTAVRKIRDRYCQARNVSPQQADLATLEDVANAVVPTPPAAKPGSAPPAADDNDPFKDHPPTQRKLLLALCGRGRLPIAEVQRAVYGRKRVSKGALERLVTRANSKLLDNNSHLAIQRSANTYRLESDCPSPPAPQ